ncbi:hypothetical protein Y032_0244g3526 [Ancylostoma ceylanicum]|uniref:Uncharacterized protein n=1 Tax=Ancylostoma ceylanicum TaxID=53326 RepID=A0A016SD59_9BILA|nr:hypothetical protein Y032_0244g3526 [Ancylostoma ceylanicum]
MRIIQSASAAQMSEHVVDGGGDHLTAPENDAMNGSTLLEDEENVMHGVEEYFYELLIDMDLVSKYRHTHPMQIQAAQMVLSREILRVWDLIYNHRFLRMYFDDNGARREGA